MLPFVYAYAYLYICIHVERRLSRVATASMYLLFNMVPEFYVTLFTVTIEQVTITYNTQYSLHHSLLLAASTYSYIYVPYPFETETLHNTRRASFSRVSTSFAYVHRGRSRFAPVPFSCF